MTTTDTASSPETAPNDTSRRFELKEPIGRGGMATVFRARDQAAEQDVAIKVLHDHLADDDGMVEVFEREAALMQRIDHPGVVRVHGIIELDGRPAIVMQLCESGDLSERLARRDTFSEDDAVDITRALLEALDACHDRGVVHRDVKPHNVMFDADGNPKLIDFGIGQAEELMAADDAGQLGTVEYMAPERIDGLAVDARTDLYSVGVVLFELLCGHVPYRADSASAVMRMHRDADIADPRVFNSDISDTVADAVLRAMAKHPEQRFDGADDMLAALDGDADDTDDIPPHPDWQAAEQQFGQQFHLAAPIQSRGHEWVVFVPPQLLADRAQHNADFDGAIDQLVDEYGDYLSLRHDNWLRAGGVHLLERFGVARGLSRQGAERIVHHLEDAGVIARYARRPRTTRDEPGWKQTLSGLGVLNATITAVIWAPILIVIAITQLPISPDSPTVTATLIFAAICAGIATGWIGISQRFREWWLSRVSRQFLFDFCRNRSALADDNPVDEDHFQLLADIESPRIAASFRRALNMALHLRDRLDDDHRGDIDTIIDTVSRLADRIVETETAVAAVRPGELTAQIRRIDRQIAGADDIDTVEPLMDQKAKLREQLTRRDADMQRLQTLAQRLHELAARLEELVRLHTTDTDDDNAADDKSAVEPDVVLDFDHLSAELDQLAETSPSTVDA